MGSIGETRPSSLATPWSPSDWKLFDQWLLQPAEYEWIEDSHLTILSPQLPGCRNPEVLDWTGMDTNTNITTTPDHDTTANSYSFLHDPLDVLGAPPVVRGDITRRPPFHNHLHPLGTPTFELIGENPNQTITFTPLPYSHLPDRRNGYTRRVHPISIYPCSQAQSGEEAEGPWQITAAQLEAQGSQIAGRFRT